MRNGLHHLDMVELYGPDIDSNMEGGSGIPTTTNQDSTGPESTSIPDHETFDHGLPSLLSKQTKTSICLYSPHPF